MKWLERKRVLHIGMIEFVVVCENFTFVQNCANERHVTSVHLHENDSFAGSFASGKLLLTEEEAGFQIRINAQLLNPVET